MAKVNITMEYWTKDECEWAIKLEKLIKNTNIPTHIKINRKKS